MKKNQSPEMKTVVETFFVEETRSLIHDNEHLEKWNDLVAFLQLYGQQTLTKDEKSPVPFLWMNSGLIQVFKTLCPVTENIEKYSKMPIPLEILELVALSKREGYFTAIHIWYDEKTPDPVVIGLKVKDGYENKDEWYQVHYSEKYLIGKWSDVKASFAQLMERAKQRFINEQTLQLKATIKNATRTLEDLEETAQGMFYNGVTPIGGLAF